MAKSQNSSQMNLSGSSSSLTSDASTKAGTVSLRSYGIGGALLHKRILLITAQQSRESSTQRGNQTEEAQERRRSETEKEEGMQEKAADLQGGLFSAERQTGRSRQRNIRGAQADKRFKIKSAQLVKTAPTGSPPRLPGSGPRTPSPLPQPQQKRFKPSESPIRTRLLSPFRVLRGSSQSRGRPVTASSPLNGGGGTADNAPSSPQDKSPGQGEQRAGRSGSPLSFLWLCKNRHGRRKTV